MFRRYADIYRTPVQKGPLTVKKRPLPHYKCEFCDDIWHSETEVHIHNRAKHQIEIERIIEEGRSFCLTCLKCFKSNLEKQKHFFKVHLLSSDEAQHVERDIFICDDCHSVFFNKQLLVLHYIHVHKLCPLDNSYMTCLMCSKRIRLRKYRTHFYVHGLISLLGCPICLHKCSDWDEYNEHMQQHPKLLICDICCLSFTTSENFLKHSVGHRKDVLACNKSGITSKIQNIADKYFIPKSSNANLYKKIHPFNGLKLQDSICICIVCRKICVTAEAKVEHYIWHINYTEKTEANINFVCECGEEFKLKILWKQHRYKCRNILSNVETMKDSTSIRNDLTVSASCDNRKIKKSHQCNMMESDDDSEVISSKRIKVTSEEIVDLPRNQYQCSDIKVQENEDNQVIVIEEVQQDDDAT